MKRRCLILISIVVVITAIVLFFVFSSPDQFEAEIRDTAEKIGSDTFNLVLLSDLHYDPTKHAAGEQDVLGPTMKAISRLIEVVEKKGKGIDAFWNLGDFINGHDTNKEEAIAQIRTVVKAENEVSRDFHNIAGNHDNNIQATYKSNAGYPESEILTVDELNAILLNHETNQTEVHSDFRPTDYYVDFPPFRVICLSADYTTFMPETVKWLQDTALDTKTTVLILSHIPTRREWGFRNDVENGEQIEKVIKNFVLSGGTVIAYIYGHDHGDMINQVISEDGNVLFSEIAIACARFQFPTSNGTPGMTYWERNEKDETKLLFDVVCIDQAKREVRFIRFGAGEDRRISY